MEVQETVVDTEPLIDRIRRRFNARSPRCRKFTASFDQILAMFQDPLLSLEVIGRRIGASQKLVGELYRDYFSAMAPSVSKRRLAREAILREGRLREFPRSGSILGEIARGAEQAGLTVRRTYYVKRFSPLNRIALDINGHRCAIRRLTGGQTSSRYNRSYTNLKISRGAASGYDAHILWIAYRHRPRRILVVPTYVFQRFLSATRKKTLFWIPDRRLPTYHNHRARIDWLKYENAWHLLE